MRSPLLVSSLVAMPLQAQRSNAKAAPNDVVTALAWSAPLPFPPASALDRYAVPTATLPGCTTGHEALARCA